MNMIERLLTPVVAKELFGANAMPSQLELIDVANKVNEIVEHLFPTTKKKVVEVKEEKMEIVEEEIKQPIEEVLPTNEAINEDSNTEEVELPAVEADAATKKSANKKSK
jgi:hypothetical protein